MAGSQEHGWPWLIEPPGKPGIALYLLTKPTKKDTCEVDVDGMSTSPFLHPGSKPEALRKKV